MIHVSDTGTLSGIFCNAAARFSVPVFVILSGYYMLSRRHGRLAPKCLRLFALMLFWSGIYYGYDLLHGLREWTGVRDLLVYLLTEPVHLWYLYAAIALYLFTPLLYVFAENASESEYRYALGLTFLFGSPVVILLRWGRLPVLNAVVDRMKVPYLLGMVFLYLLGGYLRRYGAASKTHRYVLYGLGLAGTAATAAGTARLQASGDTSGLLLSFFAPNVIAEGAAVFVFSKYFFRGHPVKSETFRAFLHALAQCTLGIYLLHPLMIRFLQPVPMPDSTAWTIVLRTLLTFAASAAVVAVLKKLPVGRRIVG